MRIRLVGSTDPRPPVAETYDDEPTPVDPPPLPGPAPSPLVLVLADATLFHRNTYLAMGYNHFDVMCIGAAGGYGGWYRQFNPNGGIRQYYGGAPGGGGSQRIKGRLALLPPSVPVQVGGGGSDGAALDSLEYPVGPGYDFPDGGDGGASKFGNICKASGGKGGHGCISYPYGTGATGHPTSLGGDGGVGGSDVAGGGATAIDGAAVDGVWNHTTGIGQGGAGGKGGGMSGYGDPFDPDDVWTYDEWVHVAGNGGAGAYSEEDADHVMSPGNPHLAVSVTHGKRLVSTPGPYTVAAELVNILPGGGAGAKTFPIDASEMNWGSRPGWDWSEANPNGRVVIRLTHV